MGDKGIPYTCEWNEGDISPLNNHSSSEDSLDYNKWLNRQLVYESRRVEFAGVKWYDYSSNNVYVSNAPQLYPNVEELAEYMENAGGYSGGVSLGSGSSSSVYATRKIKRVDYHTVEEYHNISELIPLVVDSISQYRGVKMVNISSISSGFKDVVIEVDVDENYNKIPLHRAIIDSLGKKVWPNNLPNYNPWFCFGNSVPQYSFATSMKYPWFQLDGLDEYVYTFVVNSSSYKTEGEGIEFSIEILRIGPDGFKSFQIRKDYWG